MSNQRGIRSINEFGKIAVLGLLMLLILVTAILFFLWKEKKLELEIAEKEIIKLKDDLGYERLKNKALQRGLEIANEKKHEV